MGTCPHSGIHGGDVRHAPLLGARDYPYGLAMDTSTSASPAALLSCALLLLCAACAKTDPDAPTAPQPPSLLLVIADDMGYGDLGHTGNPTIRTPHLDAFAAAGFEARQFYVQPVCAPTRAELLTGRYARDVGVTGVQAGEERLDASAVTLPEVLAEAGYRNGLFGKWHNGAQAPNHPRARGFERFFGYSEGHWATYFDAPLLERADTLTRGRGYLPDELTDAAIDWLAETRSAPSFTMLSLPTPHSPMHVPDAYYDAVAARPLQPAERDPDNRANSPLEEDLDFTRAALAMVENIDDNFGRLLRAVDSLGLAENTVVVFMSDNGPNSNRYNAGLRGQKGSVDEGGTRSPLFVRHVGRIAPGIQAKAPLTARDLLPTLVAYLGLEAGVPDGVTGRSFAERLTDVDAAGEPYPQARQWNDDVAVRRGRYLRDQRGRLYDIHEDAGQTRDISAELPDVAAELAAAERDYRQAYVREEAPRPYTVGHAALPYTHLSAGEATASGEVPRSNRYPNSSYFLDWRDGRQPIAWPVEVVRGGDYRVTVYGAVPPAARGAQLSLKQLGAGATTAPLELREVYDPPMIGAVHDRVPRGESEMKDFRGYDLGVLELVPGADTLALTWAGPAAQGPEVRLLRLDRVE